MDYTSRGPYPYPAPGSYPPRFPLTSFKVRGYERYVPDYARRNANPTPSKPYGLHVIVPVVRYPCSCSGQQLSSSRDDSTRRRSRTPEQTSRYASRYRSPTLPREHWSPSKRHTRQNQDDDIMMRDSVDEEWIIRRAYDSGRADERRRLHRVLMSALDADAENWKGVTGEELITL